MQDYPINMLGINLTYKCNLNCFMCGQRHMKIDEISREVDFDKLCEFILSCKKKGLRYGVYLWGGEPFLYSKISELLKFLNDNRIPVTINTNGTKLETYAENIIKYNVHQLIISIDGINEVHDKIRGVKGTYQSLVQGIEKLNSLRKFGLFIATNTVVTSQNYMMLFDILTEINKLHVNHMECQLPIFFSQERGKKYEERMTNEFNVSGEHWKGFVGDYSLINIDTLISEIEKIKKAFGRKFKLSPNLNSEQIIRYFNDPDSIAPNKVCALPFSQIHVEPNGDAVVCPDFPDYKFGNIYTDSTESIWNSEKINAFRESINKEKLPLCNRCCQFYAF